MAWLCTNQADYAPHLENTKIPRMGLAAQVHAFIFKSCVISTWSFTTGKLLEESEQPAIMG